MIRKTFNLTFTASRLTAARLLWTAARLVWTANHFKSGIALSCGKAKADAKSFLDVLALPSGGRGGKIISPGDEKAHARAWAEGLRIEISASGPDEEEAMRALEKLIGAGFRAEPGEKPAIVCGAEEVAAFLENCGLPGAWAEKIRRTSAPRRVSRFYLISGWDYCGRDAYGEEAAGFLYPAHAAMISMVNYSNISARNIAQALSTRGARPEWVIAVKFCARYRQRGGGWAAKELILCDSRPKPGTPAKVQLRLARIDVPQSGDVGAEFSRIRALPVRLSYEAMLRPPDEDEIIEELIYDLCRGGNREAREAATRELAAIGEPCVKYLAALLKERDTAARKAAAGALERIGGKVVRNILKKYWAGEN